MVDEVSNVNNDSLKRQLTDNEFYTNFRKKRESVPLRANFEFTKLVRYTKPYLKKINVPVLIAQGQNDPVVPAKSIDYRSEERRVGKVCRFRCVKQYHVVNQD